MANTKKELNIVDFEKLASSFFTQEEIAAWFGVSLRTINRRIAEDAEFGAAWERGQKNASGSLRLLQWRHAKMPNNAGVSMTIHMSKHYLGQHDRFLTPTVEDIDRAIRELERRVAEAGEQPAGDAGEPRQIAAPQIVDGSTTTH